MPTVTYRGRWPTKRSPFGEFSRGIPQTVTQNWLESNRGRVEGDPDFVVAEDANALLDLDADGDPDKGWTRQQLYDWLTLHDVRARAGLTKAQLLRTVRDTLGMEETENDAEEVVETTEEVADEGESTEEAMNGAAIEDSVTDSIETEEVTE